MKLTGENRRTRGKTRPSATLSTINPTWTDPGSNPGLRGRKPAANSLSHGTANCRCLQWTDWHECTVMKDTYTKLLSDESQFIYKQHYNARPIKNNWQLERDSNRVLFQLNSSVTSLLNLLVYILQIFQTVNIIVQAFAIVMPRPSYVEHKYTQNRTRSK
jgi:hypothetical protein